MPPRRPTLFLRGACHIYLKFTHNNLHSQGNHYDSIVNGQKLYTNNLELLSEVAVNELPVIPKYIDGFTFYKVKTDYRNWTKKT